MAVLKTLFLAGLLAMSKAAYLELDEAFSPPAMEPTDPRDMIYTSPANEEMLKPILVSLKHDNGSLVTENVVITASSILSVNWNTSFPTADYYTGKFCRIGTYHHSYWPPRHHDNQRVICLTNSTYSLGYVQNTTYDGVARFELLMHTVVTDGNSRRIVFSVEYGGSNLTVATHPFSVHPEGAKLQINYPANFPNISVNTPMTITVQTFYMDPLTSVYMPLSVGRHSVLHVDLSVSWDSKVYSVFLGEGYPYQFNTLRRADVILGGSEVEMNAKDDLWIRKQCVNGTATFNDVRILTVASDVHINITQSQPYFPWMRIPTQYNDTFQFLSPLEKRLVLNESDSPGTAVTNGFDVLSSEGASLNFSDGLLDKFVPQVIDANLPFTVPLVLELTDASGIVITDGPDASLSVNVEIDPSSACLSTDSSFGLVAGVGTFPGSICSPVDNVRLRFTTTTSSNATLTSSWTPYFTVTGELHIAAITSKYGTNMQNGFFLAACDIINDGLWDEKVGYNFTAEGRSVAGRTFLTASGGLQQTLAYYRDIKATNMDPSQHSYVSIVGAYDDQSTVELSTVSQSEHMPIVGYIASKDDLSRKEAHPYFSRVQTTEKAQYLTASQYFLKYYWTKVIVVRDSQSPLAASFYNAMSSYGIDVLEIIFPTVTQSNNFTGVQGLEMEAERIKSSGIRVIVSFLAGHSLFYGIHEAMRLQFTCADGFQWVLFGGGSITFPTTNGGFFCNGLLGRTCTAAFTGYISILPQYSEDLHSGYWQSTLFYYFVMRDPWTTFSHQLAMIAPMLTEPSLTHDSVLAIFHGAISIIKKSETITGEKLSAAIRLARFVGGSGMIAMDSNGDRSGCVLNVYNTDPVVDTPTVINQFFYHWGKVVANEDFSSINESYLLTRKMTNTLYLPINVTFATTNFTNTRRFRAEVMDTVELRDFVVEVPAAFYCMEGCGGGQVSNDSIIYYNYGTCVAMDQCQCKTKVNSSELAYGLNNCSKVLCNPECKNGYCRTPDNCACDPGWSGDDCGIALCTMYGCDSAHGRCTYPNSCTCDPGYWSPDCSQPCSCQNGLCIEGQTGTGTCRQCDPGYFGINCASQCTCSSASGNCSEGITGDGHCLSCEMGYFGEDCNALCTCVNGECDSGPEGTGMCSSCDSGYFGGNCQQLCSCQHGVCDDGPSGTGKCKECHLSWAGDNCHITIPGLIIPTALVVIVLGTIAFFIGRWYYKRMKFRAALASNDWIIDYNEVIIVTEDKAQGSQVFRSMVSMQSEQQNKKAMVRNVGKWHNIDVVIKSLEKGAITPTMEIRVEVKHLRDLRHPNIASFVGASLDLPNVCILMEMAPKGSLDDLLMNDSINVDWTFKYSLLKDICRGMNYIAQSPIKCHGRLKSSNCVIDNRWTLKLTDFGLQQMKSRQQNVPQFDPNNGFLEGTTLEDAPDNNQLTQLLWTAPELLKKGITHLDHVGCGTIEGDVFSMAIIVSEMLTNDIPYSTLLDYIDVSDVLRSVAGYKDVSSQLPKGCAGSSQNSEGIRPELPDDTNASLKQLVCNCWTDSPEERPSFSAILKELNHICPQKGDLMDNLVNMVC
jgi:hypothetical protein